MLFIAHRINTATQLQQIPLDCGVEIDLRDKQDGTLILQHDPYSDGENFDDWLAHYKHAFLILNIKSEGIEWKVLEKIKAHAITEYMFLDCSIPMIMKLIAKGESNIAIRYSEVEPIELAQRFLGNVKWLWVDCFTKYPKLDNELCKKFKICLVSPALQGRDEEVYLEEKFDAVCEKIYNRKRWLKE
jgi:hypothetical protein